MKKIIILLLAISSLLYAAEKPVPVSFKIYNIAGPCAVWCIENYEFMICTSKDDVSSSQIIDKNGVGIQCFYEEYYGKQK